MKAWMKLACVGVMTLMIASCNTIEGFGRDLEEAGDTIEDAANRDGS